MIVLRYSKGHLISNIFYLTVVTPSPNSTKNEVLLRVYESALVFRRAKGSFFHFNHVISYDNSDSGDFLHCAVLFCRTHSTQLLLTRT